MAESYASLDELKSAIQRGTNEDSNDDAELQRALDAATTWIESTDATGRVFRLDTADVTRVYDPPRCGELDVRDLVTITSIALDTIGDRTYTTALTTTDYDLLPFFSLDGTRYQTVRNRSTSAHTFIPGQLTRVVGKYGYVVNGQVPQQIKMATLLLATRWFERHRSPFGVLQSAEFGTFGRIASEDMDVKTLLGPYSISQKWVIV